MKILVTGSRGFIGRNLVRLLTEAGARSLGLDLHAVGARQSYVRCDLRDRELLEQVFAEFQPEFVVHLAARTDLLGRTLEAYDANTVGVQNLVHVIEKNVSVRRCIFTSSQLVCHPGYTPKHDCDFAPNTVYGESKVQSEKIVRDNDGGGVEWCIVRPTTIWGPGMSEHYQRFFRMIESGQYMHIGHAPLYKSYGFVGNTVYQYQKLIDASTEKTHGKVFYLADYVPISLRAWIDMIRQEFGGKSLRTIPVNLAKAVAKLGDIINWMGYDSFPFNSFRLNNVLTEYQFDLREIERITGPLPYTMSDGVTQTVAWLREAGLVSG